MPTTPPLAAVPPRPPAVELVVAKVAPPAPVAPPSPARLPPLPAPPDTAAPPVAVPPVPLAPPSWLEPHAPNPRGRTASNTARTPAVAGRRANERTVSRLSMCSSETAREYWQG